MWSTINGDDYAQLKVATAELSRTGATRSNKLDIALLALAPMGDGLKRLAARHLIHSMGVAKEYLPLPPTPVHTGDSISVFGRKSRHGIAVRPHGDPKYLAGQRGLDIWRDAFTAVFEFDSEGM